MGDNELGEFLRHRRGRIGPSDVGLPPGRGRRQTPGLRREELAAVAGVSVDYYTRLEQGRDHRPGPELLDAIASALLLSDDEREHLHRLARHAAHGPTRRRRPTGARAGLVQLLETVRPTPAYVLDPISDILASNPEGIALLDGLGDQPSGRRNIIRYVFTEPRARDLFDDWWAMARDSVAHLRTVQADDPDSVDLDALVSELSSSSADFERLWRDYDVRVKSGHRRSFHHPSVGRFSLTSEILTAVDGQRFVAFQAVPGSRDAEALTLVALTASSGLDSATAPERGG